MNPLREAAIAIHEFERDFPELRIQMDVSHRFVHLTARCNGSQLTKTFAWQNLEDAFALKVPVLVEGVKEIGWKTLDHARGVV